MTLLEQSIQTVCSSFQCPPPHQIISSLWCASGCKSTLTEIHSQIPHCILVTSHYTSEPGYQRSPMLLQYNIMFPYYNTAQESFLVLQWNPFKIPPSSSCFPPCTLHSHQRAVYRLTDNIWLSGEDGVLKLIRNNRELIVWCPVNCDRVVWSCA